MSDIFLILFFVFIGVSILGLVRPELFKDKNGKHPSSLQAFFGALVIAIVFFVAFGVSSDSESEKEQEKATVIKADASNKEQASNISINEPKNATEKKQNKISKEDIVTANNFCKEASALYSKLDKSFKDLQTGISASKKSNSPEKLANTIQSFILRASELEDDAMSLSYTPLNSEVPDSAMLDMVNSVVGVSKSNSDAAKNLRALFSGEQSPERTQENAKGIGERRDFFNLKYGISVMKLFNALGYKVEDLDSVSMCLKKSS